MIDEILNVLSHAEDEGSSSSQENTPQHTNATCCTTDHYKANITGKNTTRKLMSG